ncbi:MAG: hypothetical protein ACRDOH_07000 [Streptosporangiaceae bacterium]
MTGSPGDYLNWLAEHEAPAGRTDPERAPLAGLRAGTGRTYIAEELREVTGLAARPQPGRGGP